MCRNVCGATKVHKGQPGRYVASHISLDSGKLTSMHCRLHAPVFMLGGICVGRVQFKVSVKLSKEKLI